MKAKDPKEEQKLTELQQQAAAWQQQQQHAKQWQEYEQQVQQYQEQLQQQNMAQSQGLSRSAFSGPFTPKYTRQFVEHHDDVMRNHKN